MQYDIGNTVVNIFEFNDGLWVWNYGPNRPAPREAQSEHPGFCSFQAAKADFVRWYKKETGHAPVMTKDGV